MNETKPKLTTQGVIQIFTAIGTAVALVLLSLGYISDAGAPGDNEATARGVTNFDSLTLSEDLIVTDDSTLTDDVAVGGDLTVTGSSTFAAVTMSDGDFDVADTLNITPQTAITVTNGAAFTATGTIQYIQAASEVTPTITAGTAGDLLVLINTSAQTVNIADTGNQVLTAAAALGQYDSITLFADGTRWIEISRADN